MIHCMLGNGDAGNHAASQPQGMDGNLDINRSREQDKGHDGTVKVRVNHDYNGEKDIEES